MQRYEKLIKKRGYSRVHTKQSFHTFWKLFYKSPVTERTKLGWEIMEPKKCSMEKRNPAKKFTTHKTILT
jgi:hypothetical protein